MCKLCRVGSRFSLSLLLLTASAGNVRAAESGPSARLETFVAPDGQGYFAMSLKPSLVQPKRSGHEVVILFDTSASQAGAIREKALAALESLVASLEVKDRVALLAVDLNAVPLTPAFVSPKGTELRKAMADLRKRVPLGSTDMYQALEAAVAVFARGAGRQRSIVYLGDGMSTARLIAHSRMERLVGTLVEARVSVNSLAIGPRLDTELLGALANHTGGRLVVDIDESNAKHEGRTLADAAHGLVVWPSALELPEAFSKVFPRRCPPLRFDREMVLVGKLDGEEVRARPSVNVRMRAELAGKAVELSWDVRADETSEDHSYLARLVAAVEPNGGIAMPALGSSGLAELRQALKTQAQNLARLGQQALATGSLNDAHHLAAEAARLDPLNPEAATLAQAVERARDAAETAPRVAARRDFAYVGPRLSKPTRLGRSETADEPGNAADGALLDQVERRGRVFEGYLRTEVQGAIKQARGMMATDAENAGSKLKVVLEKVQQSSELNSDVRSQLSEQVRAALQAAGRQELVQADRALRRQQVAAEVEARERINRDMFVREQKVEQLMARFSTLMEEERYRDAEVVADIAEQLEPGHAGLRTAELDARMVGYASDMAHLRDTRYKGFVDACYATETSAIPNSDEPPILYPNPEVWQTLTERRKKYKLIDLAKDSPSEARIAAALTERTELDFTDQPLSDVIEYLKDKHEIEIQFDSKALTDTGVGSDTPVTRNIRGITLRSALRLLLGELDMTYVIRHEVLLITSKTEAENILSTRVYPVGDLVIRVQSPTMGGGGMGGGMGGGGMMGGGMGGMGGGMMGGGMGGMGGGMMGGGAGF